jgi:hypothetical protein
MTFEDEDKEYNKVRMHQGRWCNGRTPMHTFPEA